MFEVKFPFQDQLLKLGLGEETVLSLKGHIFIVKRGSFDDIERIGKGLAFIDEPDMTQ